MNLRTVANLSGCISRLSVNRACPLKPTYRDLSYEFRKNPVFVPATQPDVSTVSLPKGEEDVLQEQLKKASSVSRIMLLIEQHHAVMNNSHMTTTLRSLFNMCKTPGDFKSIPKHAQFALLEKRLTKRARFFDPDELVTAIKHASLFGLPASSVLMQALFQLLRHQVNSLSMSQILFMNMVLLRQTGTTPLVEALKIALPLVAQNQLDVQMDRNDVKQVVGLLSFGVRNNFTHTSMQKILQAFNAIQVKPDVDTMIVALYAYFKHSRSTNSQELSEQWNLVYTQLSGWLLDAVERNEIPGEQLQKLMATYADVRLYDLKLMDTITEKSLVEKWPIDDLHNLCNWAERVDYSSLPFYDYVVKEFLNCPNIDALARNRHFSVYSLAMAFYNSGYFHPLFDRVFSVVSAACPDKVSALKARSPAMFLNYAAAGYLLSADKTVAESAVRNVFTAEFIREMNHKYLGPAYRQEASQTIVNLSMVVPPDWIETEAQNLVSEIARSIPGNCHVPEDTFLSYPMQGWLEKAMGGKQYLATGVFTKNGHFIDHVIVLRKGNYPLAFKHESTQKSSKGHPLFLDDVLPELPAEARIIGIVGLNSFAYTANTARLKACHILNAQALLKSNIFPVQVPLALWQTLPDFEKIPFLMKLVLQTSATTADNHISQAI